MGDGAAGAPVTTTVRPCTCPAGAPLGVEGFGDPCFAARAGDCKVDGADAAGGAGVLGAAAVTVGGEGVAGVHDSDSERIGSLIGNDRFESGVPGGTSMVKGICTPPSSVTVTMHGSADADGSHAAVITATTMLTAINSRQQLDRARVSLVEGLLHARFMV
jgi:hypothetical protein